MTSGLKYYHAFKTLHIGFPSRLSHCCRRSRLRLSSFLRLVRLPDVRISDKPSVAGIFQPIWQFRGMEKLDFGMHSVPLNLEKGSAAVEHLSQPLACLLRSTVNELAWLPKGNSQACMPEKYLLTHHHRWAITPLLEVSGEFNNGYWTIIWQESN